MGKVSMQVTLDEEIVEWVEEEIEETQRFSSVSHAVRRALYKMKKEEE